MGVAALGSKMASDITGCPKKAVLILYERAPASNKKTSTEAAKGAASALDTGAKSAGGPAPRGRHINYMIEVQYNPSSLRIQGNSKPVPITFLLKHVDNGVPNQAIRPPSITMTVDLMFDDTNIFDAFMSDKGSFGVGSAITAASAVHNRNKGYSVQAQTNSLIAALMRPETSTVKFQWASFSFTGIINQAQARYTMFSVSGKPIRSVVRLVIGRDLSVSSISASDAIFDGCFKSELNGSGGSKSALQKVGNVLNVTGF